ncbi:hypothetical protein CPB86DRAFT_779796 [Serendipita vermifera]|nr:hypothetical protein CPB86DRAFT_779796 [Serendipita vermifera]
MSFSSKPLNSSTPGLNSFLRRNPAFFGVPFVLIIVGASFGLKSFMEVGVEKKDGKVTTVTKDEEVRRKLNNARKFDIREEYFRHFSKYPNANDWDNVRVQRPQDVAEWGERSQDSRKRVKELVRK